MSKKQVPGQKKPVPALSREEQLRLLWQKLEGNKAFAAIRGGNASYLEIAKDSESPSQFRSRWRQCAGDAMVMGNVFSQMKRDGWKHAIEELQRALTIPGYLVEGESIPLDQTVPVTIVIMEFPKTLAMLTWVRAGHFYDLDDVLDGRADEHPLAKALFDQFPSLREYSTVRREERNYEGGDLIGAYCADVANIFEGVVRRFPQGTRRLGVAYNTYNDRLEISKGHGGVFGFLIHMDQKSVLKLFSREQQTRIATWQCRVPTELSGSNGFSVGFHPEKFHGDWQNKTTFFASHGCSHGYGAVILPTVKMEVREYCQLYSSHTMGGGYCRLEKGEQIVFVLEP